MERNKINKIMMSGIKGQDGKQDLTGRDIIIGNNGAGKTTRMQAMSLAALGYVPGKGKTIADTFELASDDTMTVGIETETSDILRAFVKSSKLASDGTMDVKITQKITVTPSQGERSIKEKEQRISEILGDFPTMLDFGAFIELTDNKKRDFIYNLGGQHFAWDRDKVYEHLKNAVLTENLEANNPDMYEVMGQVYSDVIEQYSLDADVTSGLLAMAEYARDQLSYWRKEKKNADAAAQKLTEIKNKGEETDRGLAENQEKLASMEKERDELMKMFAAAECQNDLCKSRKLELDLLLVEIRELEKNSDSAGRASELEEDIKNYSETIEINIALFKEIEESIEELRRESVDLASRGTEKQKYISGLEAQLTVCNEAIKKESELIELITNNAGCCAFSTDIKCSHDFSGFVAARQEIIDAEYSKKDELEPLIAEQKALLEQMQSDASELEDNMENARDRLFELRRELNNLELLLKSSQDELHRLDNAAPILASKRQKLSELEAWLEQNPYRDCGDYQVALRGLDEDIETLKSTIDTQKKIRNDILNIKSNIIDSKTATYQQECWKQVSEAIGQKGIQGEIVKEMLDPLRDLINEKLTAMGIKKSFFFETENDRGKEIFQFGWSDHGDRRPFGALSQGEQLLLLIAMMTTIIEQSDANIRILAIDNINHLDHENLQRVIGGLNKAGENMDNIILAGTPDLTDDDAPGWKVWRI